MMKKQIILILIIMIMTSLFLAACGGNQPEATEDPQAQADKVNLIYTQAAETLQAEIAQTEAAKPKATSTPLSSPTPALLATNTPLPSSGTPSPFPTLPSLPTPTLIPTKPAPIGGRPCLRAELLFESPRDGVKLEPGASFVKVWNFANAGECEWNQNFNLIHMGGPNLSSAGSYNLMDISNMTEDGIPNGGKLEIALSMQAPENPGSYKSIWMLRDDNNNAFGVGALGDEIFWVEILVRE